MASDFPGSPLLLKGALVVFEAPERAVPTNIIAFQYNPDAVRRSIQPQVEYDYRNWDLGAREPAKNILPPSETFDLEIELDAADQIELGNVVTRTSGLHPTLAALELLAYPRSSERLRAATQAQTGAAQIGSVVLPIVLLVWGAPRVVPVAVSSISISEEAFDQLLNPIRARVGLSLRALTEKELKDRPPFDKVGLVRHVAKEILARTNLFNSAGQVQGMVGF